MPSKRKIAVGVCGGVAAYKAAELVRALQREDFDVHVVMTRAAQEFVRPLTFASLTGHKVITSLWPGEQESSSHPDASNVDASNVDSSNLESSNMESSIEHIASAQMDLFVVAPATAHTLAKLAHGFANDFLSTMYLATTAPVIVCPAMNVNMWNHPATRANLDILRGRGVHIVAPGNGALACGMVGEGRLAEISEIVDAVRSVIRPEQTLAGETVLITAGGTREPIDPVRFIGNRSSGRMGYRLAESALARGARVILISAPAALVPPAGCEVIPVTTSAEMRDALLARLSRATIVIKAAAVSDFRPITTSPQKLKREQPLILELAPTEDVLKLVVARRNPGTLVIAFAAETENMVENARAKLLRKGVDAIVANDVSQPGVGFDSEENDAVLLTPERTILLGRGSKLEIANRIFDHLRELVPACGAR